MVVWSVLREAETETLFWEELRPSCLIEEVEDKI